MPIKVLCRGGYLWALETFYRVAKKNSAQVVHCSQFLERTEIEEGKFNPELQKFGDESAVVGLPFDDRNKRFIECFINNRFQQMTWLNFYRRDLLALRSLSTQRAM